MVRVGVGGTAVGLGRIFLGDGGVHVHRRRTGAGVSGGDLDVHVRPVGGLVDGQGIVSRIFGVAPALVASVGGVAVREVGALRGIAPNDRGDGVAVPGCALDVGAPVDR